MVHIVSLMHFSPIAPLSAAPSRPVRTRCTGSKLALRDTKPLATDPYNHYAAICPVCDRVFSLPQYALPIHYVTAAPVTTFTLQIGAGPVETLGSDRTAAFDIADTVAESATEPVVLRENGEEISRFEPFQHANDRTGRVCNVPACTGCDSYVPGNLTNVPCQECGRLMFAGRVCCTPATDNVAYRQPSFDLPNAENDSKTFPNKPGDFVHMPGGLVLAWCLNGHANEGYALPAACLACRVAICGHFDVRRPTDTDARYVCNSCGADLSAN